MKYVPFVDVCHKIRGLIYCVRCNRYPKQKKGSLHIIDACLITNKSVHCKHIFALIKEIISYKNKFCSYRHWPYRATLMLVAHHISDGDSGVMGTMVVVATYAWHGNNDSGGMMMDMTAAAWYINDSDRGVTDTMVEETAAKWYINKFLNSSGLLFVHYATI